MKLFVNLAWIADLIAIFVFIGCPAFNLLISDNYITDPEEVKIAVISIIAGLLILSPITCALNVARKFVNRDK